MPAYLCHGFRWQRRSIRVYVVVQNLDDASPEWIIPAKSSRCILESFYNLFEFLPYRAPPSRSSGGWSAAGSDGDGGDDSVFNTAAYTNPHSRSGGRSRSQSQSQSQAGQRSRSQSQSRSQSHGRRSLSRSRAYSNTTTMRDEPPPPLPRGGTAGREDDISSQDWSVVKLLEEYDPMNLDEVSRPYAYVADYVKRIDLSASIFEEIQKYEEQVRANRDDAPMVLGSGASSDETGRSAQKSNSSKKKGGGGGWFEQMRDQLQRGEEIRWYVVVNGDEVRDWPDEPIRKNETSMQRPTPTKEQMQHHRQYMLQQQIFTENDKYVGRKNTRPEAGTGGRPAVPEKDLPPLGGGVSVGGRLPIRGHPIATPVGDGPGKQEQQQQQKPHGKGHGGGGGGFRRLFSKSSSRGDDYSF